MTLEQLNDFKERFRDAASTEDMYHLAVDLLITLERAHQDLKEADTLISQMTLEDAESHARISRLEQAAEIAP